MTDPDILDYIPIGIGDLAAALLGYEVTPEASGSDPDI